MRSAQDRVLRSAAIVLVCFGWLPKMEAVECFSTINGRMEQFSCRPSELCCGSQCCADDDPFYTHWYFWLAVCMFLLVVVGFALSACRHFRKQRKSQQCSVRTKPSIGADLLLNYHLLRTDVISLPLYDDVVSRSQFHITTDTVSMPSSPPPPPPPLPLPLPPPSYCDACSSSSNSRTSEDQSHDQPPPSYSECVMQD